MIHIDYRDMFHHIHQGFFDAEHIRQLPESHVFDEQLLELADFSADALEIPCPDHITFGLFSGDIAALHAAVAAVDPDWVQYFKQGDRVYCAFDGDQVASFCILDDFGTYHGLKIGAPGCVGTVPAYRRQGIGLKMVQKATAVLKDMGYDLSYIHYTHVGHWYARLGYQTILKWNCRGLL